MGVERNKIDRRNFLKKVGAAGVSSVFISAGLKADPNKPDVNTPKAAEPNKINDGKEKEQLIPKRKLGRANIEVPVLALGTMFDVEENQLILRRAYQLGVRYWDTAHSYSGGKSELGVGKFLTKSPQLRKDLIIATKASGASTAKEVEQRLQESLEKMKTDYVDIYYGVHGMSNPENLTEELKLWSQDAKKRGLIRYFGFTTHTNMAKCLAAAAKLDWIDVIMSTYNYRVMKNKDMQEAAQACHQAGIALVAMKTQSPPVEKMQEDEKIKEHFLKRGLTPGQAKVMVVLEDKRITTACVGRDNLRHMEQNAEAVRSEKKLSQSDIAVLQEYAKATCTGYCIGCSEICSYAVPEVPCINDIMRYLMYYDGYGEHDAARELFAEIPQRIRHKLLTVDYRPAEFRCPQNIPIGKLIAKAVSKLT